MKIMKPLFVTMLIAASSVAAGKECLDDVTDAAIKAKECLLSVNEKTACKQELKQVELSKLICLRDGASDREVEISEKIGDLMVDGEIEDSPLARLVAQIVKKRLEKRPLGLPTDLERRLRTIEERLKTSDASRVSWNAELLKVQGQVNGLMLDRSVR